MEVNIKEAKELARYYYKKRIPAFMHGPPGVGKSDVWKQIAEEEGVGFLDIRLSQMDPVDVLGLPHIEKGHTNWARPVIWPDKGDWIILFDELSDCTRAMQTVAYQIILNDQAGPHKIAGYKAAAGNRREDRAGAQTISTALANRFGHITVRADHEAFIEWGYGAGISSLIIGFLRFRPGMIHSMEGANMLAFASPRSWARANMVLDAPVNIRFKLLAGLIGEGPAGEFEAFLKITQLPTLEDILADPVKCPIPPEPSTRWALGAMLARNATRNNIAKICTYTKRPEFGRDYEIITMLDATKRDRLLIDTKAYVDFTMRNQDLVL